MEAFFSPRSIALIGASRSPGKVGADLWQKLQRFKGKAYAVNPKFGFSRITMIPGTIDLAVIAVPAPAVPAVINDCVLKKTRAIIVISSGFSELGAAGVKLRIPPIPLLGPNCFGLADPAAGLDLTFAKTSPPPGNIGLISQSGALASYLFNWAKDEHLGFSKFISLGNRLNLTEIDGLKYLTKDPATKVIGLYLESFADGSRWLKTVGRIARKKPVIVLFAGQTKAGRAASLSHTASLSPSGDLVRTALAQSGCFQAKSITDFTNLLEIFSLEPGLKDNDLAIITNAGGPAILATDTAGSLSFDVAKPIDVFGDARADRFRVAFDQTLQDKTKDAFLIIITPQAGTEITKTCRAIIARFKHLNKPVVVSLLGGKLAEPARKLLQANRIATIDLPDSAAASLAALLRFYRQKNRRLFPVRRREKIRPRPLTLPPGRLNWRQAALLAQKFNLPLAKTVTLDQPVRPFGFAWPLVLKTDPSVAPHRTESKAIILNLNSAAAVRRAYRQLKAKFSQILAQEQQTAGQELFVGIRREPGWPPLLVLGGGGLYTELYRDLSRAFLPLNAEAAAGLLAQTRIGQIIAGYRRQPPLAGQAVIRLILNVCKLAETYPSIKEIEINPAIVTVEKTVIVDLKIVIF